MSLPVDAVNWLEFLSIVLFICGCACEFLPHLTGDKKAVFQFIAWFHAAFISGLVGFGWMSESFWMWQGASSVDYGVGGLWISFTIFNGILAAYALITFALDIYKEMIQEREEKKRKTSPIGGPELIGKR